MRTHAHTHARTHMHTHALPPTGLNETTELLNIPIGDITRNQGKYLISSEVVDPELVMSVKMHYGVAIDKKINGKSSQIVYFLGDNDGTIAGSRLIGEWDGTYIAIRQGEKTALGYVSLYETNLDGGAKIIVSISTPVKIFSGSEQGAQLGSIQWDIELDSDKNLQGSIAPPKLSTTSPQPAELAPFDGCTMLPVVQYESFDEDSFRRRRSHTWPQQGHTAISKASRHGARLRKALAGRGKRKHGGRQLLRQLGGTESVAAGACYPTMETMNNITNETGEEFVFGKCASFSSSKEACNTEPTCEFFCRCWRLVLCKGARQHECHPKVRVR